MDFIRKVFYFLAVGCGTLLIVITLLSQIDSPQWYLEVLGFPRLLILIILPIFGLTSFLLSTKKNIAFFIFAGGLAISECLQLWIIFPYTPLAEKIVKSAVDADTLDKESVISIVVANVLMSNRNADALLKTIDNAHPTLVLAMEVNSWWVDQLRVLNKKYPYRIVFPTDNTYGMSLYSQLPLSDTKILFLNNKNVPSFLCNATLANGKSFQLMTVHPVAPKPSVHPDNMGKQENGLMKAAHIIARQKIPSLVIGDFNDVGWSKNMRRFTAICNLNDIRQGRGLYNTFKAQSFIFKWPLDYVFVSNEFKVINLERLPAFGSDHYPYLAKIALFP